MPLQLFVTVFFWLPAAVTLMNSIGVALLYTITDSIQFPSLLKEDV